MIKLLFSAFKSTIKSTIKKIMSKNMEQKCFKLLKRFLVLFYLSRAILHQICYYSYLGYAATVT